MSGIVLFEGIRLRRAGIPRAGLHFRRPVPVPERQVVETGLLSPFRLDARGRVAGAEVFDASVRQADADNIRGSKVRCDVTGRVPALIFATDGGGENGGVCAFRPLGSDKNRVLLQNHVDVIGRPLLKEIAAVDAGRATGEVVVARQDVDRDVDFREALAGPAHDIVPDGVIVEKVARDQDEVCLVLIGDLADAAHRLLPGFPKLGLGAAGGPVEGFPDLKVGGVDEAYHRAFSKGGSV